MYLKIQNLLGKCLIEFMIKHLFLHLTSQVLVQPTPSVAWFSNATTAVLLSSWCYHAGLHHHHSCLELSLCPNHQYTVLRHMKFNICDI